MKQLLLLGLLLSFGALLPLHAQPPFPGAGGRPPQGPIITGRITGTVVDSLSGLAVEFGTVVLIDLAQNKQLDGVVTEPDGSFKLTNVKTGRYKLQISFLGYRDKIVEEVSTTPEKPDRELGRILLSPDGINLEQVTVTGQSAVVENRIDKLVYNAEKDISNTGGDAADVLRRVPLLSVDLDGNVSLRGSSNILVLVNGRPSTIFAGSIADALKTIPADQIKSVEVITSPSAKYDGEGSSGIINIITKRKTAEGLTGSVNTSIGTRQNNATLNLNGVRGRFGLNGSANAFWSWRREGEFNFLREDFSTPSTTVFQQTGSNATQVLGYNGSVGAFYDINAYHALNASVRFNGFGNNRDGVVTGSLGELLSSNLTTFERANENQSLRNGFDAVLDYRRTFPNTEREFTIALQLSGTRNDANNEVFQMGNSALYEQDVLNTNDGLNLEYIGQIDYVHPFSPAIKLETGVKSILRRINSDYQTQVQANENSGFVPVPFLTDVFYYDQDVYAGYVSFNLKLGKNYGLLAGARYEQTTIGGRYDSELASFDQDYHNILPSITLSRTFKNFQTLKLSYNRRIQRPSLYYINPFTEITDPNNVSVGNPSLNPELVDQVELSFNTFVKGVSINASVYYRETNDLIESFLEIDPSTQISQTLFLNIGTDRSLGFNGFASATIKKVLTIRGGINVFSYNGESTIETLDLSRSTVIWNGNMSANLKLARDWQFEAFGFFRSPRQTLQGINASFWLMSMGIRKDFNKRMSLGIRAIDPFFRRKRFPTELRGESFYQRSEFSVPFQSYGISFQYSFGKLDFTQPQRRKRNKIDNTDLKEGGDSNF